jgi:hypothetical protein
MDELSESKITFHLTSEEEVKKGKSISATGHGGP